MSQDPAYDAGARPKLSLTEEPLTFPYDESELITDSFGHPGGMGFHGCDAGCCPHDPAPQWYGPGDRWVGPGHPGCVLPVWHLWRQRLWFRGEYLLWWARGSATPPLVTTGPDGANQDTAGVLPDATVLVGDSRLSTDTRSGGRMTLGYWFDPCCRFGLETSYLSLGTTVDRFRAESTGDPILARPFFNIQPRDIQTGDILPGRPDRLLVAFGRVVEGSIAVDATSEFQQFDIALRRGLFDECNRRLDFVLGYQYSQLDDELAIASVSTDPGGIIPPDTMVTDLFRTENQFNGVQLGLILEECVGRWTLEMLMKVALGNTHSRVRIDGSIGSADTGGLLALESNMGVHEASDFAVMPQLGITLAYDLTCRLRATLGYSFIYWSRVARPGDQIDLDVNPDLLAGGAGEGLPRPEFSWVTDDYWAQGLSFGLEYRF